MSIKARPASVATGRRPRGIDDRLGSAIGPTHNTQAAQAATATSLVRYDALCRALAEANSVDEVMGIRDEARQIEACARIAGNHEIEAGAVAIRMRATRRLGELIQAQKESVGLATGGEHGGRRRQIDGLREDPSIQRPTLAMQGINKNLAHKARVLWAMDKDAFERKVVDATRSQARIVPRAVREAEIAQERAERRARTAQGGSVADLHALIASGFRAGVIAVDPPWPFEGWSERANRRVTDHYETMTIEEIKALPIRALAASVCAIFCWVIWPFMPVLAPVLEAWGVTFSGLAFDWIKLNPNGEGLHWGGGYNTRANPEPCILAKIGSPLRLDEGVHSVIMAPVGAHSEKPNEACRRMQRLYGGPYLELFARRPRERWVTWGNEIERPTAPSDPSWDEMWARPFDYSKLAGGES
jgi:N6-adenosine-specific RNA methylase IME4